VVGHRHGLTRERAADSGRHRLDADRQGLDEDHLIDRYLDPELLLRRFELGSELIRPLSRNLCIQCGKFLRIDSRLDRLLAFELGRLFGRAAQLGALRRQLGLALRGLGSVWGRLVSERPREASSAADRKWCAAGARADLTASSAAALAASAAALAFIASA